MILNDSFSSLTQNEKQKFKFKQCEFCQFYECELICEYSLAAKNNNDTDYQTEIENSCIMANYSQIECGTKYVSEGIGDHFKINLKYNFKIDKDTNNRWQPTQPVFISAQTGTGKNHFIENTVLPYVRRLNYENRTEQRVLILSNRIALRLQVEDRIKYGLNNYKFDNDKAYPYGKFTDVMSYQSLLRKSGYLKQIQEDKMARNKRYLFVVCDEAHFFTSDAMFNPDTEKILSAITNIFCDAIRIYMTATPYDCLEYINTYESKIFAQPRQGVFYHFKRDYEYLNIKYYSSEAELIELIAKSKDRWLIFIDDKEKCKTIKKELESQIKSDTESKTHDIVFAVDASSKNDPKYQEIILKEKFGEEIKVLITTSVVDNGVNFKDPKLKHVVFSGISKEKCIQQVGRIRLLNNDDKITLYIKRISEGYMQRRINDLEEQQDAYHDFDLAYASPDCIKFTRGNSEYEFLSKYKDGTLKDHEKATHWFGRDKNEPSKLYINRIARSLADKLVIY